MECCSAACAISPPATLTRSRKSIAFYSPGKRGGVRMPRDPLEPTVLPKISVVICTFNRHGMHLEAIMSIELQDLPDQEYELIIVDNSDDLRAREQFRDGLQISCAHRWLDEARPGLSRARNIGIHAARADLVAFLDDDAKASSGWLRHIIEAFSTNEAAGVVGGPVRP